MKIAQSAATANNDGKNGTLFVWSSCSANRVIPTSALLFCTKMPQINTKQTNKTKQVSNKAIIKQITNKSLSTFAWRSCKECVMKNGQPIGSTTMEMDLRKEIHEITHASLLPVLGAVALMVVMIFNCGVVVAGPNQTSADYVMLGCRDAAELITFSKVGESEEEISRMSFCAGVVVGLSFMGQPYGICVPAGTTPQQVTSIVVQYIDGQPARVEEDFNSFAVEALRANWPCSLAAGTREPLPVALR